MTHKEFCPVQIGERSPVTVLIPMPDEIPARSFVGRESEAAQCLAAWSTADGEPPLQFRLAGPPGCGKNELVYHLARECLEQPLYVMQGHEELGPDDLACTARVTGENRIEYVGSPLLAAMLTGGICFFDELGKVPERSLSLLASVLDDRRTLTSVLAGFTVGAHSDFRFCAALNDADATTGGLPDYIDERTRPVFRLGYPPPRELFRIVKSRVPGTAPILLRRFREWAVAQLPVRPVSPRTGQNIMVFADRLRRQLGIRRLTAARADRLIEEAARTVLDEA